MCKVVFWVIVIKFVVLLVEVVFFRVESGGRWSVN